MVNIAAARTLAVAVGSAVVNWTSTDGRVWHLHQGPSKTTLGPIVAANSAFFAAGDGHGVWTSTDGVAWTRVADVGDVTVLGVGPNGVLAVGDEIWMGPPPVR
jgi:hypothetical protein